jgi:hypothetical protein
MEKWHLPPEHWYKFNFDAAIQDSFSTQAAVCRNRLGHIIYMVSHISHPCLSNFGEALAALLAVSLTSRLNLDHFIIEGDSHRVILAL